MHALRALCARPVRVLVPQCKHCITLAQCMCTSRPTCALCICRVSISHSARCVCTLLHVHMCVSGIARPHASYMPTVSAARPLTCCPITHCNRPHTTYRGPTTRDVAACHIPCHITYHWLSCGVHVGCHMAHLHSPFFYCLKPSLSSFFLLSPLPLFFFIWPRG